MVCGSKARLYRRLYRRLSLIIILLIIVIAAVFIKFHKSDNMILNDIDMLSIQNIEDILKVNEVPLELNEDYSVEKYEFFLDDTIYTPVAYSSDSEIGDITVLIYELDQYVSWNVAMNGISEGARKNLLITYDAVYGKNIIVWPIYHMTTSIDEKDIGAVHDLREKIFDILYINAFNGKNLVYSGEDDNWSVIVDVQEFRNVFEESAGQYSISEYIAGNVFVKYKNSESAAKNLETELESIAWEDRLFSRIELEPLVESDLHEGYYHISIISGLSSAFDYNADVYNVNINGSAESIEVNLVEGYLDSGYPFSSNLK